MKVIAEIDDTDFRKGYQMSDWEKYAIRRCSRGIIEKDGKVALMHVSKLGFYKLPGGGIKFGETNEEGFKREALEEAGTNVEISENPGVVIEWRDGFKLMQISYVFFAKVLGDLQTNSLEEDELAEGFKLIWVDSREALKLVESSDTSDYESNFIVRRDSAIIKEYLEKQAIT